VPINFHRRPRNLPLPPPPRGYDDWQDLPLAEQREFVMLDATYGGEDDGAVWRWKPEPGVTITCANGRQGGGGMRFIPDETGGGVLQVRSKVTMQWKTLVHKKAHTA